MLHEFVRQNPGLLGDGDGGEDAGDLVLGFHDPGARDRTLGTGRIDTAALPSDDAKRVRDGV